MTNEIRDTTTPVVLAVVDALASQAWQRDVHHARELLRAISAERDALVAALWRQTQEAR